MRITNNILSGNMLRNMNNNLNSMNNYQNQMASGKKIQKPSDDPIGITKIIKLKTDITENAQYKENNSDAKSWLEISENSLNDMKDMFQRIRELAVQGANGTNTTSDTAKIAQEIEQLKEEIISSSNSSIAGKYVFSGFKTDEKFLKKDGTFNFDITSKIANEMPVLSYEVTVGEHMDVGVDLVSTFGIVDEDNLISNNFPVGENEGTAASHTKITGDFDLELDYTTGGTINIEYPTGTIYAVDVTNLKGTVKPIDKDLVLDRFLNAANGGNKLSDVAEVYFDNNNKLVMEAKSFGAEDMKMGIPSNANFSASVTTGVNSSPAVITGTVTMTDADVLAETEIQSFVVTIGENYKKIDIDLTTLTSLDTPPNDLETAVQTELDLAFPSDAITVDFSSGSAEFSLAGANDGSRPKLSVDVIKSKKPKLIEDLENFIDGLNTGDDSKIQDFLGQIDVHINSLLSDMGEIGAKTNRIEFIESRIDDNTISYTALLSKIQDVDYSEAIIKFKSLESIYRASLSVGAQVIKPTLVDFLR